MPVAPERMSFPFELPTKRKDGLMDYETIACNVSTTDTLGGPLVVTGTATYTGFANAKKVAKNSGGKWLVTFARETHWNTCIDITKLDFTAVIAGTTVAAKQVKIEQDCGGGD